METFQGLLQYGALGFIAIAAGYGAYAVGKAAWSIYLNQRETINTQHSEMVSMSEKHSTALNDVRVQTSQALDNNTQVMLKISSQITEMTNRLGSVEDELKALRR